MKLTVVIPAFNEERAIGSIIERSLAAREKIVRDSPVDDVEIIVVSDGSTDRTAELATAYVDVRVIVFDRNRGYGAAIKRGFQEGSGELVGFLDADGTCDPGFFARLCTMLIEEHADVAIGSRLGPGTCMPPIRRLGNRVYALILSALSNRVVTDTASGMRVIRRDVLPQLYPLPDGLHFTPAMSARVLMGDGLTIVEEPMRYEERVGDSKLHVLGDGLRFLRTIFEMTLMWQPAKLFIVAAVICLSIMALLAMHPIEMWMRLGRLQEDMIYRLLFCSLLGTSGVTLLSAGALSEHLRRLLAVAARSQAVNAPPGQQVICRAASGRTPTFVWSLLDQLYSFRGWAVVTTVATPLLVWLVGRGVWTWASAGYVDQHWSRVVLAGLVFFGVGQMLITVLIANVLRFHTARRSLHVSDRATDPVSVEARTVDRSGVVGAATDAEVPPVSRASAL